MSFGRVAWALFRCHYKHSPAPLTGLPLTNTKEAGKRCCFKRKDEVSSLLSEFATITTTLFHTSPELRKVVHYFVCKLYSDEPITEDTNVDLVRMRVFCHRTRDVERKPPTSDALDQHLKRSVFQASIWTTAHEPLALVPSPSNRV